MDGHQTGADLTDCSECRTRQPRHGAELVRHLPALDPPSTKYAVQISAWPGPVQSSYKHAVSWCLPSFPRHPTLWRCLSRLSGSVLVEAAAAPQGRQVLVVRHETNGHLSSTWQVGPASSDTTTTTMNITTSILTQPQPALNTARRQS